MNTFRSGIFYVRCPYCFDKFDYLRATPLIKQPILQSFLLMALCPNCEFMFLEGDTNKRNQMAYVCSGHLNSERNITKEKEWPWAVTCGITLKYNFGDFFAALRFGQDLPPYLYKGILEGRFEAVFLPVRP